MAKQLHASTADIQDLKLHRSGGDLNLYLVTLFFPQKSLADRTRYRNFSLGCIRFLGRNQRDGLFGIAADILYLYLGEDVGLVRIDVAFIDEARVGEGILQLRNPRFEMALRFLGRVIFRILRKVSLGARFRYFVGNAPPFFRLKELQLVFEVLKSFFSEVNSFLLGHGRLFDWCD